MTKRSLTLILRLLIDRRGQDVIEYALLSAFIALAGLAVLSAMNGTMSTAYTNWIEPMSESGAGSLPEMPDPLVGS